MTPRIRFCRSREGVRVAFGTSGSGPPLVGAPAWLTHLEFDWDIPVWRHWYSALSEHHTLVRYDLRGCGLSDRDVGDSTLDDWVADLEAVTETLDLERFVLFGLCQGSAIAAAYAVRHPERVSRLVLYGGYVKGALAAANDHWLSDEVRALAVLIENGWGRPLAAFRELFARLLIPAGSPQVVQSMTLLQKRSTAPKTARKLWLAFHSIDIEELVTRIRVPTLVLHCHEDAMVPFAEGRRLATLIPGAQFVAIEGRNHIIQENEAGWRVLWREVRQFLKDDRFDLTPREGELLDLIALGRSNFEISHALSISPKTVRNHVSNIFAKLSVTHRAEAVVRAREAGYGSSAGPQSRPIPGN